MKIPKATTKDERLTPPPAPSHGRGRLFLHMALVLMLAIPAVTALVRSPTPADQEIGGGEAIDETAPEFSVDLFDGETFTLTDHLAKDGRPVVMNFWASWCVPCREEMPVLDAVASHNRGILVLGVAVQDTETAARAFAEEIDVSYPLGHDTDGAILEQYPILGVPTTWFITSEGVLATRWAGQLDQDGLESLVEQHLTG